FSRVCAEAGLAIKTTIPIAKANLADLGIGGLVHLVSNQIGNTQLRHGLFAEIRLIRHVTGQGCVMAKYGIFDDGISCSYSLKEIPEMGTHIVKIRPAAGDGLRHWLMAKLRIILLVPFFLISIAHGVRKSTSVITWSRIFAGLRRVGEPKFRHLQNSLRTLETVSLRHF